RELATASRLFLENFFARGSDGNRLSVCNLRLTDIRLNAELAPHTIDNDLKMKLAHPGNDRLAGFVVCRNLERGIFLCKAIQSDAHLVLVGTCFRFDRYADDRIRKVHRFENDGL